MEKNRDKYLKIVRFVSSLGRVDARFYEGNGDLGASCIAYKTPASLASADGLTEEMDRDLSSVAAGIALIHRDCFGRTWVCTGLFGGILVVGPFLTDNDSEALIAGILRQRGISHASVAQYFRSLPLRDDDAISALAGMLLVLENGVPGESCIVHPGRMMSIPLHDPSLEERIRIERDDIEGLYDVEKRFFDIVAAGDKEGLRQMEMLLNGKGGVDRTIDVTMNHLAKRLPGNPLRLERNLSISLNTLLRLAAGRGGLSPLSLHGISERFAILIERSGSIESISRLRRDMIRTYVDAVRKIGIPGYSRPVKRALQHINENLDVRFSLKDLASVAGLHPVSLSRLFRKETGITLTSHIRKRRMEEARWLLSDPGQSVTDTALMVGYEDSGAFSKAFSREIGMTPRKFRSMKT